MGKNAFSHATYSFQDSVLLTYGKDLREQRSLDHFFTIFLLLFLTVFSTCIFHVQLSVRGFATNFQRTDWFGMAYKFIAYRI